jgi:Asp-tRNA(Asn)/Glu-tRNA(Gln) amidotransferase C subunit
MTKNTCKNFIKKFKTEEWYRRDWNEETRESFFQPELTADQIETLTGIISKGFEQFAALNADWKANKSNLKSGSRKADEAKAAREADKIARGYTSDPVVRGELDRLAAPAKVALAERFIAHRANELDNLLELFKKYNVTEEDLTNYCTLAYSYIEQRSAGREDRAEEKRMEKVNASMREALFATHNYDRDNQTFSLKTAEQNQAEAVRYADDVWETFLGKMEFKVCGLGITSIESTNFGSSEGWTSTMNCTARNGITFTLTNSIVLKCSYLGTWFNQFPARFGDVCRNGQAVKNAADKASVRSLCSE